MATTRGFLYGIIFTVALLLAAAVAGVYVGALPAGADAPMLPFEKQAAKTSLHATIARDTAGVTDPLQPTVVNLSAGVALYAANCAMCHGAADGKPSLFERGLYIAAPQLAKDPVDDDPEPTTYWKLVHGIRFSAMPSFEKTLTSDQLWQLTLFLKHMPDLPAPVEKEWQRVPSVAPKS